MLIGTCVYKFDHAYGRVVLNVMKRQILVLCDREKEYAGLMGDFLKTRGDLPWDVHIYSDTDQMFSDESENEICLLVIAESTYAEEMQKLNPKKIVLLNEEGNRGWKDICSVNKYQQAENVLRELLEVYLETAGESYPQMSSGLGTKFIGIYSPIRRCMQTTFALTLGQMLAEEHKTLYLNFEHFAGHSELMAEFGRKDLADLLYYLNEDKDRFFLRMQSIVQKAGKMDYVPPMKSGQNLLSVAKEDWQRLMKTIDEMCGYEYVIMDLTDSMQGLFEIMRNCEKIFTITKDDRIAKSKLTQYEQILSMYQFGDVIGKTKKCDLPKIKRIPDDIGQYTKSEMADYIRMQFRDKGENREKTWDMRN